MSLCTRNLNDAINVHLYWWEREEIVLGIKQPTKYKWHKYEGSCNAAIWKRLTETLQFDLQWPLTLSCDIEVRHTVKVPIVHLWSKFGCNRSEPVHAGAIWKRATITITIWRQITNNLTSSDLWPCHVTSKSVITWRFPLCTLVYLWSKFGCNWSEPVRTKFEKG